MPANNNSSLGSLFRPLWPEALVSHRVTRGRNLHDILWPIEVTRVGGAEQVDLRSPQWFETQRGQKRRIFNSLDYTGNIGVARTSVAEIAAKYGVKQSKAFSIFGFCGALGYIGTPMLRRN